jgi:hypothetical protein
MLGLGDYLSDGDEDTPTKPTPPTPILAQETKDKGSQSKKRVINVSLPLAFDRDDDDEDAEARPAKKVNAGSSLANLLPAPKNASVAPSNKKPTKPTTITPTLTSSSKTSKSTIKAGPTKTPVARTTNPLLHLHRTSASTPAVESTDDGLSSEEPFFPIADPLPPRHVPARTIHTQENSEPYPQPPRQAPTQHSYPEAPAPYYPQQQEYNVPYHPEQDQYYTQQQSQQSQQTQINQYFDPNATPEGIIAPYKGRNKREPDFSEFGANIIEVNQKDMLGTKRPG